MTQSRIFFAYYGCSWRAVPLSRSSARLIAGSSRSQSRCRQAKLLLMACTQVAVRVRPILPQERHDDIAVTCSPDGSQVQVCLLLHQHSQALRSTSTYVECNEHRCVRSPATGSIASQLDSAAPGPCVQVLVPERQHEKPLLAASRPDARAFEFDACLPGSITQVRLRDASSYMPFHDKAHAWELAVRQFAVHFKPSVGPTNNNCKIVCSNVDPT